jgi:excisionase family DNA binding protein
MLSGRLVGVRWNNRERGGAGTPCARLREGMEQHHTARRVAHARSADDKRSFSPLIGVTELAALLGVDARHIYRLVAERRIPYIKWGHLLRFDPAEVRRWLDGNRVEPLTERGP